jgi:uncharacterized membrane protein YdjX (TVP38/TMEM64 family)
MHKKFSPGEYLGMFLLVLVIALSIVGYSRGEDMIENYLTTHTMYGALTVAVLMFGATVVAPIALLPLIPLISPMLGPFVTSVACWVGWSLGAVASFWIARYGGKPLVSRWIDFSKIEALEARIPESSHFVLIVALRLIIPVDILSYALGLFSRVSLLTYSAASALGILWFSFAFSYLGYAIAESNTVLFIRYSVVSAIIIVSAFWYVRRTMIREKQG